ncbi:MAG: hypothetical protein ACOZAJ_03200 [Patescibacteria group bacterium]
MYLLIDGVTSQDLFLVLLDNKGQIIDRQIIDQGSRREVFLKNVANFLSNHKAGAKIKGLAGVNKGGSFSRVRQACVLLNALAFAWQVPVVVWSGRLGRLKFLLVKIKQAKVGAFIQPRYNGPGVG